MYFIPLFTNTSKKMLASIQLKAEKEPYAQATLPTKLNWLKLT